MKKIICLLCVVSALFACTKESAQVNQEAAVLGKLTTEQQYAELGKYVQDENPGMSLAISQEEALRKGVEAEVYETVAAQMEQVNAAVKEQLDKGGEVISALGKFPSKALLTGDTIAMMDSPSPSQSWIGINRSGVGALFTDSSTLFVPTAKVEGGNIVKSYTCFDFLYNVDCSSSWILRFQSAEYQTSPTTPDLVLGPDFYNPVIVYGYGNAEALEPYTNPKNLSPSANTRHNIICFADDFPDTPGYMMAAWCYACENPTLSRDYTVYFTASPQTQIIPHNNQNQYAFVMSSSQYLQVEGYSLKDDGVIDAMKVTYTGPIPIPDQTYADVFFYPEQAPRRVTAMNDPQ